MAKKRRFLIDEFLTDESRWSPHHGWVQPGHYEEFPDYNETFDNYFRSQPEQEWPPVVKRETFELIGKFDSVPGKLIDVAKSASYSVDNAGRMDYNLQVEIPPIRKVALIGKMHSGKSTFASVLRGNAYDELAFAAEVKDISVSLLNSIAIQVNQHLGKGWETIHPDELNKNKAKYRVLLQWVGAYVRDVYGDDAWIKVFADRYKDYLKNPLNSLVVSDARYPNEAEYLRDSGWTLVRIERPEDDRIASIKKDFRTHWGRDIKKRELREMLNHESEVHVNDIKVSYVVLNNDRESEFRRIAAMFSGNRGLKG